MILVHQRMNLKTRAVILMWYWHQLGFLRSAVLNETSGSRLFKFTVAWLVAGNLFYTVQTTSALENAGRHLILTLHEQTFYFSTVK